MRRTLSALCALHGVFRKGLYGNSGACPPSLEAISLHTFFFQIPFMSFLSDSPFCNIRLHTKFSLTFRVLAF